MAARISKKKADPGLVALVTGAGRGIGRATALAFAEKGACLFLVARTKKELDETAKEARKRGAKAFALLADLRDPLAIEAMVTGIRKATDRLDILVNNAGFLKIAPLEETSLDHWETTLRVNLTAPFLLAKSCLPLLRRSQRAHVFNLLSVAARTAFPGSSAYCASKAGLLGLNGVLREELRAMGIRVTAITPGATDTKMFDSIPGSYDRKKFVAPEDVASAILAAWKMSREANVDEIQITPQARV